MPHIVDQPLRTFSELGNELDAFVAHAKKVLPPDRFRVFESSCKKLETTAVRFGVQLGHLVDQFERLNVPPKGPRGPATIHRLVPRKKRR